MGKNTVEIIIAAKDRTSAAFAKVNTQMKTMGGATGKLKSSMGGLTRKMSALAASMNPVAIAAGAATIALATMGGAAIKASLDFEKASATIRVGTGATGEALAGLEESFKTVYTAVPASTADAATAIADLNTRLELTGKPLEALATQFLNLSRITKTDVSASIKSATRVMHDFAVSSEEQSGALDYLFKVSQSTGIGMTNLANNMTKYGGVMRQMGFDINTSAALLGKFEKEGVNLELVLSSLRMGLANFARAGEEPVEALKRVIAEIQGMGSAADRNLKAIEIFGARSGPDMAAAIYEGRFSIEELMATLDASSETINKAAADTMTFGDKWTLAKNNIMTAIEPIGDVILNVLGGAMEGAGKAFNILKDAVSAVKTALDPLTSKMEELRKKFAGGIDTAQLFSDIIVILTEGAKILGEKILGLLKDALTPFVKKLEDAIAILTAFYDKLGPIKTLIEGVKGVFGKAVEDVHAFAESIKEAKTPAEELEEAIEDVGEAAEEAIAHTIKKTEEAIEKQKEFTVTIGDTTIEFKGMAVEVVKNADAYEKLQRSAQTLIDLDWSTFTEFEAALPRIEAGLGDLGSSFVGFKNILEDNIDELENVKDAVMDISAISAPFLEAGFLKGVESIGKFAGSLKDAGSAINTFANLQDISIDGCIDFTMHVRDMVSALELLEGQMEDLVPVFGDMDSLMGNIVETFVWTPGKKDSIADEINRIAHSAKDGSGDIRDLYNLLTETTKLPVGSGVVSPWMFALPYMDRYNAGVEEIEDITNDFLASEEVLERQMGYTTEALAYQTGQLNKITEALQPYLEFMRTLNELAALSTLSTTELNAGLNSINDTLVNLGEALSTFDLRPVMESLFGTKIAPGEFTGGITTAFTDTMFEYASEFSALICYVERLSNSVLTLVSSFEALANISESVLADQDKLKGMLEGMVDVFSNFNLAMGGGEGEWGFGQKIADGIDAMLKSATPLVLYFQNNNAAIEQFNMTLKTFTSILKTVTDAMDMLKRMSEMVLPEIVELELGFNNTGEAISRFTEAMSTSFAGVKIDLEDLDMEWTKHKEGIDKLMKSFGQATDTVSTLATKIVSLTGSLKELRDMSVLSMYDIDRAMKKIPVFLDSFVKALALNMYDIVKSLKELDTEWLKYADDMKDTMPAFESSSDDIGKLVGALLSLNSALKELAEMGTISGAAFDRGFTSLMETISNFAGSLSKNVDGLIVSLQTLRDVWMANEAVLFPLIRDFAIISDNLYGVAHNANRMTEEFKTLSENSETLKEGFENLIGFIDQVVKSTKEFYTPEAAAELAGYITDVEKVIAAFVDLEIGLKGAMEKIERAISAAVRDAKEEINSFGPLMEIMYDSGVNLIQSLINGIAASIPALQAQMDGVTAVIEGNIGVSSPTRLGPLRNLEEWGPNLVKSFSKGINSEMHTLDASFASMAPSMSAGTAMVGGTNNVNLYVTQNIGSQADADYANQGLARLLSKHKVM